MKLHVLLGAGGVGKTTLAAGFALALAERGRQVGLLGIDPSRRLQDALGVELADRDAPVADAPGLRATIVQPHQAVERWVAETCADRAVAARLTRNPFFVALGDRLATATDVLAAARIAEWAEVDPALTDLVVDTAPGVAAVDFLRAPAQIEALLAGRIVRWLRAAARGGGVRAGAGHVLLALSRIAGTGMVTDLAEFFAHARAPLERMLHRVERAQAWLRSGDAELLIVTSPRDAGAAGAAQLVGVLRREGLAARAVVVNRTWPPALAAELAAAEVPPAAAPLAAYAGALVDAQARVLAATAALGPPVIVLPSHPSIDHARRAALAALGAALTTAWSSP